MTWDIGAYEYKGSIPVPPDPIPPDPLPGVADIVIKLRAGNSLKNVKITRRKRDKDPDLLITVNKSTVVLVE